MAPRLSLLGPGPLRPFAPHRRTTPRPLLLLNLYTVPAQHGGELCVTHAAGQATKRKGNETQTDCHHKTGKETHTMHTHGAQHRWQRTVRGHPRPSNQTTSRCPSTASHCSNRPHPDPRRRHRHHRRPHHPHPMNRQDVARCQCGEAVACLPLHPTAQCSERRGLTRLCVHVRMSTTRHNITVTMGRHCMLTTARLTQRTVDMQEPAIFGDGGVEHLKEVVVLFPPHPLAPNV